MRAILPKNWLTAGQIDFEAQQYRLLDYFQKVRQQFLDTRLYPVISQLEEHFRSAVDLYSGYLEIGECLDHDTQNFPAIKDPKWVDVVRLLEYSIPMFRKHLDHGKALAEAVAERLNFEEIGLQALRKNEGLLLVDITGEAEIRAYHYQVRQSLNLEAEEAEIKLRYLRSYVPSLYLQPENIKSDLLRKFNSWNGTQCLHLHADRAFPLNETLLPVGRRKLLYHLQDKRA